MLEVRNARTGQVDYTLQPTDNAALEAACAQLRAAQPAWSRLDLKARERILLAFAAALAAQADDLVAALVADTGHRQLARAQVETQGLVIREAVRLMRQLQQTTGERETGVPGLVGREQLVPYPLVANIGPWNFPLALAMLDAWPALVAGCAVIVKPSELTSRWVDVVEPLLEAAPDLHGVLRIVRGDGRVGAALVEQADMVCFTGSVETGRAVAAAAGRRFIPASLELGGKDPAIVTRNADLARAATAVLKGAIPVTGQSCMALERVYVEAPVYAEFVDRLVTEARSITLNYPNVGGGHLGPFIDARQAHKVLAQLEAAVGEGARILTGGQLIDHGGLWMQPTVVVDVRQSMALMRDETFGPVIPVLAVPDVATAVTLANDSRYGLSAAVFSGDPVEAAAIAEALQVGVVSVNDAGLQAANRYCIGESFGFSGLGRSRMGLEGVARFVRRKAILGNQAARVSSFRECYYSDQDDERSAAF